MMRNYSGAIEKLNSLLDLETSAVETYKKAIDALPGSEIKTVLEEVHVAHMHRVNGLRGRIEELDSTPQSSAPLFEGVSILITAPLSEESVIESLEDFETEALDEYQQGLDDLDDESRRIIFEEFIPSQEQSLAIVGEFRRMRTYRAA